MKRTLYIHIGTPKSGTTSIQICCNNKNNNAILRKNNIYYPIIKENYSSHRDITQTITLYCPNINYEENIKNLINKLTIIKENVLLSSEFFMYDNVEIYKNIFNLFSNVYCIVYFRNIFDTSNSALIQRVKTPETNLISLDSFIFFLPSSFYTWLNKFKCSHFIFKNYDSLSKQGCLVEDFLFSIGIQDISEFVFPEHKNVSLKTSYAFFLRHCSNIPLNVGEWLKCVENITCLSQVDIHASTYTLIPSQVWDTQKEKVDAQISLEAELLQDPSWKDWCYSRKNALHPCPYTQLPPEDQHRIFNLLSDDVRSAILAAWPDASTAKPEQPLLPPIYEDEIFNKILFNWRRITFERQAYYHRKMQEVLAWNSKNSQLAKFILQHCATKCVYSLSSKDKIKPIHDIKNIYFEKGELHIISVDNDPILLLPNFYIPDNSLCIIHIFGTGASHFWQLFYCTESEKFHNGERSINFNPHLTSKQNRGAFIILPFSAIGKNLRLDPGICPGEYIITTLDIFITI